MLEKLKKQTFYFIGVTTAQSSIMEIFPRWIDELKLPATEIAGYDVEVNGPAEEYREIICHIKKDEKAVGALVTTHKIDVVRSAWDLFDYFDEYADVLREVSCISKRYGQLRGHAKDPITSGRALESFLPSGYWKQNPSAQTCILGSGGSGIALSIYLMKDGHGDNKPSKIIIADRERSRLEHCGAVHRQIGRTVEVEYIQTDVDRMNDDVIKYLPEGSLVVNATGMGKDSPGSPVSDRVCFPEKSYVWEFNYRGSLEFLRQANSQKEEFGLHVVDGWTYFIYGWALVIGEAFNIEIDQKDIGDLSRIANSTRKERERIR